MDSALLTDLSVTQSFLEGSRSFFSSCIWPLLPGLGAVALARSSHRYSSLSGVVVFTAGFILMFVALGMVLESGAMGRGPFTLAREAGGVIAILGGLYWMAAAIESRLSIPGENAGFLFIASALGMGSAAAWIPCVGPTLSDINALIQNGSHPLHALGLLSVYGMGLGFCLTLAGVLVAVIAARIRTVIGRRCMNIFAGGLLFLIGFLIFEGHLNLMMRFSPAALWHSTRGHS